MRASLLRDLPEWLPTPLAFAQADPRASWGAGIFARPPVPTARHAMGPSRGGFGPRPDQSHGHADHATTHVGIGSVKQTRADPRWRTSVDAGWGARALRLLSPQVYIRAITGLRRNYALILFAYTVSRGESTSPSGRASQNGRESESDWTLTLSPASCKPPQLQASAGTPARQETAFAAGISCTRLEPQTLEPRPSLRRRTQSTWRRP